MADVDEDVVSADETILYDLSLQSEWCLENDILVGLQLATFILGLAMV